MEYKLVKYFGPRSTGKWQSYLDWRGLELTSFDSVDNILRPGLFEPKSAEDWSNCNTEYKPGIISNIDYAQSVVVNYENAILIGVDFELDNNYIVQNGLLGFDIIDGYCDVSLLTNWGTDEKGEINHHISPNGLISNLGETIELRDLLRNKYSEDGHAANCEVWAVYKIDY